jgi:IS30 family transposase
MPSPRRPWSAGDDEQLRALHAEGKSLGECAKVLGRSKGTIHDKAKALGLDWDRERVAAATQAKVRDARARRAELAVNLLDDVDRLRKQLFAPTVAFNFGGRDNTYNEVNLDEPTFTDKLKIMQAVGAGIDRHLKLVEHDSGNADAVRSLLGSLATSLGLSPDGDPAAGEGGA